MHVAGSSARVRCASAPLLATNYSSSRAQSQPLAASRAARRRAQVLVCAAHGACTNPYLHESFARTESCQLGRRLTSGLHLRASDARQAGATLAVEDIQVRPLI